MTEGTPTPDPAPSEGEAPAPAAPVVVDPASIAAPPVVDPDEASAAFTPEQLPYVQKIRKENADRRVEVKGWTDAFAAFEGVDQSWIQETFRLASSQDPNVAAAGVKRIGEMQDLLLGKDLSAAPAAPASVPVPAAATAPVVGETTPVPDPNNAPVTVAQFQQWKNDQIHQGRVDTQKNLIDSELVEAGFAVGSIEYRQALDFTRNDTDGDLTEAILMVGRYQQAIRDGAISAKKDQSGRFPSTSTNVASGSPADPATQEKPNWENARKRLDEMLDAQPGEQV
ncbi:MAG: hypothetical protein V3S26_04235 [Acidimicrobiia bacterium]